jgi:hypothetical protein
MPRVQQARTSAADVYFFLVFRLRPLLDANRVLEFRIEPSCRAASKASVAPNRDANALQGR